MNKLFSTLVLLALSISNLYSQYPDPNWSYSDLNHLGILGKNSYVLTPQKPYVYNGYPVFEIVVPAGYTEIQVRASLTNFEPGFLLKQNATYTHHYIPTGATVNGKKQYKAMGTFDTPIIASWNGSAWVFGIGGLTSTNAVEFPWQCTTFSGGTGGVTYLTQIEYFVYRTCTTGAAADAQWGQGSGDPDPWVYIANQSANPGDNKEFKRQKWNSATSLTGQLQAPLTSIRQIDTATADGTIGTSGNITVTVTGALVTGSPLVVNVAALAGDTASVWAGKVRVALKAIHADIHDYIVGGTGTSISLTAREASVNDTTLNIALDNGTTTGVIAAPTSDNTAVGRVGVSPTPGYTVIFQPSRGNLGAIEWMQANKDKLVWIYQVENVAGKPKHPTTGSDVWNSMAPVEWRTNRIQLFSFDAVPTITTQPVNVTINSGNTATLTVTAAGSEPLTYQWYQGNVGTTTTPVGNGYSWFTTPVLNTTTTFWVRITNSVGSVNSNLSTVTVNSP